MLRYAREQLATKPRVGTAVCTTIQGLPVATCRTEQPKKHSKDAEKVKKTRKLKKFLITPPKNSLKIGFRQKRGKILKKAIAGAGGTKTLLSTIQN